ncbi:hypothetical protein [Eikenella corrodens]|jgi:hypothetical protein|uniref:hypothetical protein n=1 Tax=Eikenella corrodens TaxID=539 RepID=UPI00129ADD8B|nr:hypothetical protein [Eikenella corrodens]
MRKRDIQIKSPDGEVSMVDKYELIDLAINKTAAVNIPFILLKRKAIEALMNEGYEITDESECHF